MIRLINHIIILSIYILGIHLKSQGQTEISNEYILKQILDNQRQFCESVQRNWTTYTDTSSNFIRNLDGTGQIKDSNLPPAGFALGGCSIRYIWEKKALEVRKRIFKKAFFMPKRRSLTKNTVLHYLEGVDLQTSKIYGLVWGDKLYIRYTIHGNKIKVSKSNKRSLLKNEREGNQNWFKLIEEGKFNIIYEKNKEHPVFGGESYLYTKVNIISRDNELILNLESTAFESFVLH